MKIKNLITELEMVYKEHGNVGVILQIDSEGNGYIPVRCVDGECLYNAVEAEVRSLKHTADEHCWTEEEYKKAKKTWPRVVVLAP